MRTYLHGAVAATVQQGDCLELMRGLPDRCVNLILCDPPYATTNCEGDEMIDPPAMWEAYRRILAPGGCVVLFASQPFTTILAASNLDWLKYALVWDKNKCGSPGLAKVRPMKVHEDILVFAPGTTVYNPIMEEGEPYQRKSKRPEGYVGKANNHGYGLKARTEFANEGTRYPKSILRFPRDFSAQQQVHPHQKPLTLMRWLVETFSHPGQLILDNAAGSGTTPVAALELGRHCIAYEKRPQPFGVMCARLAALTLTPAVPPGSLGA